MANRIRIVPEDFQRATAELKQIEMLLVEYKGELSEKYSLMASNWRGIAGNSFDCCAQKVIKNFDLNIENLVRLTADIENVCKYMENVEQQTANTIKAALINE